MEKNVKEPVKKPAVQPAGIKWKASKEAVNGKELRTSSSHKEKLLYLLDILRERTDENTHIGTQELLSALQERGIYCDRRTLSKDMETLRSIESFHVAIKDDKRSKEYFVTDRHLDDDEIWILIGALQAAGYISQDRTNELGDKLAQLGGKVHSKIFGSLKPLLKSSSKREYRIFNAGKRKSKDAPDFVEKLQKAIITRSRVKFAYYKPNAQGERRYRNEQNRFVESEPSYFCVADPVSLVINRERCYLIAIVENESKTDCKGRPRFTFFRVDRMAEMEVLDWPEEDTRELKLEKERRQKEMFSRRSEIEGLMKSMFNMMPAESPARVIINVPDFLLEPIFDKFGEDVALVKVPEGKLPKDKVREGVTYYQVTADVMPSRGFFSWLAQFQGEYWLEREDQSRSKDQVATRYREFLEANLKALKNYSI